MKSTSKGSLKEAPHAHVVVAFLAPLFFARIFIGVPGLEYSSMPHINLAWLTYVCHFYVLGFAIFRGRRWRAIPPSVYILVVLLLFVSMVHVIILLWTVPIGIFGALIALARSLLWIFTCLSIASVASSQDFLRALIILCIGTFVVMAATKLNYAITGVPLNLIFQNTSTRAQGFTSEPSTIGALVAGTIAYGFASRRLSLIGLALLATVLASSVVTVLGAIFGVMFGLAFYKKRPARFRVSLLALSLAYPIFISLTPILIYPLADLANDLIAFIETNSFKESPLNTLIIERALGATRDAPGFLLNAMSGYNTSVGGAYRLVSVFYLIHLLSLDGYLFTGIGLNVYSQLLIERGLGVHDFGFLAVLISAFGIIIGPSLLVAIHVAILNGRSPLVWFAAPFSSVAALNSGGGIHTLSVVVVSAILLLSERHADRSERVVENFGGSGSSPSSPVARRLR